MSRARKMLIVIITGWRVLNFEFRRRVAKKKYTWRGTAGIDVDGDDGVTGRHFTRYYYDYAKSYISTKFRETTTTAATYARKRTT